MRDLQRHKLIYLLEQLDENSLGIDVCIQHFSGQQLLAQPYPCRHPVPNRRGLLALRATLASGIVFPVILLFAH